MDSQRLPAWDPGPQHSGGLAVSPSAHIHFWVIWQRQGWERPGFVCLSRPGHHTLAMAPSGLLCRAPPTRAVSARGGGPAGHLQGSTHSRRSANAPEAMRGREKRGQKPPCRGERGNRGHQAEGAEATRQRGQRAPGRGDRGHQAEGAEGTEGARQRGQRAPRAPGRGGRGGRGHRAEGREGTEGTGQMGQRVPGRRERGNRGHWAEGTEATRQSRGDRGHWAEGTGQRERRQGRAGICNPRDPQTIATAHRDSWPLASTDLLGVRVSQQEGSWLLLPCHSTSTQS